MLCMFALVIASVGDFAQFSGTDDVFVLRSSISAEYPRKMANFGSALVGNHHTIHVKTVDSLFGTLSGTVSDLTLEVEQSHNAATLANKITGATVSNLRVVVFYRLTNFPSYKIVNYVENSTLQLLRVETDQPLKTEFALVFDGSSVGFSIIQTRFSLYVTKSTLRNCYIAGFAGESEIDEQSRAALKNVYCQALLSGVCQRVGVQRIEKDQGGDLEHFARLSDSQSITIAFKLTPCIGGISYVGECVQDNCGLNAVSCSGRGQCIDFTCRCQGNYTSESRCRDAEKPKSRIGSIAAGWTLTGVSLLALLAFLLYAFRDRIFHRGRPEKEVPLFNELPNDEAAPTQSTIRLEGA